MLLKYIHRTEYMQPSIMKFTCKIAFVQISTCLQKPTTLSFKLPRDRLVLCLIISAINQNNIYLPITELRKIHLSLLPVATFLTVINKMIRNPYFWMAFTLLFFPAQCPSWWKSAWKLEQILHVLTGKAERSGSAPVHQIWGATQALISPPSGWNVACQVCYTWFCSSSASWHPSVPGAINEFQQGDPLCLDIKCHWTALFCQSFTFQ